MRLVAMFPVADASAAAARASSLGAALGTAEAATALLAASGVLGVSVQEVPAVTPLVLLPPSSPPLSPPLPPMPSLFRYPTAPPTSPVMASGQLQSALISGDEVGGQGLAYVLVGALCLGLGCALGGCYVLRERLRRAAKQKAADASLVFTRERVRSFEAPSRQLPPTEGVVNLSAASLRDVGLEESPDLDRAESGLRQGDELHFSSISPTSDYADSVLESRMLRARRSLVGVLHEMRSTSDRPSVRRGSDGNIHVLSPVLQRIAEGGAALQYEPGSPLDLIAASLAGPLTLGRAFTGWVQFARARRAVDHSVALGEAAADVYRRRELFIAWMVWAQSALDYSAMHGRLLVARKRFVARQALRTALRIWFETLCTVVRAPEAPSADVVPSMRV